MNGIQLLESIGNQSTSGTPALDCIFGVKENGRSLYDLGNIIKSMLVEDDNRTICEMAEEIESEVE